MEATALKARVAEFQQKVPYRSTPFASRGWGHQLHSLCSYQGKLKPAVAHWLVRQFVPKGGNVLDPLGGVGTVAFEAASSRREAISNDKSPLASAIARAKLDPPTLDEALVSLGEIERGMNRIALDEDDHQKAEFGLNAAVNDYFHPKTLEEILKARKVFASTAPADRGQSFVWACLLHVLHGNRPYALSRRSHSITPFSPSGRKEYRGVIDRTERKIRRTLSHDLPKEFVPGESLKADFRDLPNLLARNFTAIITSPPFAGMRFDRPNWLRLWFCGWEEEEFHSASRSFLEREQLGSWDCYRDFFAVSREILKPKGVLILHLGSGGSDDMVNRLKDLAREEFSIRGEVTEGVAGGEHHGLRDKGRTTAHHYLFLQPKVVRGNPPAKEGKEVYSSMSGIGNGRSSRRALIRA